MRTVIDHLISIGSLAPDYREYAIRSLDSEMRRLTRRVTHRVAAVQALSDILRSAA